MEEALSLIYEPVEGFFDYLGLMEGSSAPMKRFAVGWLVTAFVVNRLQPKSMFTNGMPRPWTVIHAPKSSDPIKATSTPWWGVPLLAGFFSGFLV